MTQQQVAPAPEAARRPSPTPSSRWRAITTPAWIARLVAAVGVMTIASALLPALHNRVGVVTSVLPGYVPAAATTGALATGTILLLLSRALRRGKFRAWLLATVLSVVTVVLHVVKGLDLEEALATTSVLVLLLAARPNFTARPDPRSLSRVLAVALAGPVLAVTLGWLWLAVDADGQAPGTTQGDRIRQALVGLVGFTGPVHFVKPADEAHAAVALHDPRRNV